MFRKTSHAVQEDRRPLLVITARVNSARFPQKVLKPIYESYSILEFLLLRLKKNYYTSRLLLATADSSENDIVEKIGKKCNIKTIRGPEDDVLERVNMCLKNERNVSIIGRVTADNPLTDPNLILLQLQEMKNIKADYSYCHSSPIGTSVDLWTVECFERMYQNTNTQAEREHINSWVWKNPDQNKILWFVPPQAFCNSEISVTIDTVKEYRRVKEIIQESKNPIALTIPEIISFCNNKISGKQTKNE